MPRPPNRGRRRSVLFGRAVAVAFLVAIAGEIWSADPALAHNSLTDSSPANGETLSDVPATWTLTFSGSVPLRSASGQMVTTTGSRVSLPAPRHGPTENVVVFDLPAGAENPAVLRWRLVSDDGHVISGRVTVTVLAAASPTTSAPTSGALAPDDAPDDATPSADGPVEPPSPEGTDDLGSDTGTIDLVSVTGFVARLLGYSAVLGIGGLVFMDQAVARGTLRVRRARAVLRWSMVALLATPLAQLVVLAARLDDSGLLEAFASVPDAATTGAGVALVIRAASALFASMLIWSRPETIRTDPAVGGFFGVLVIVHLGALAHGGHARTGGAAWLGVPVSVIHMIAAAAWLGGLAVLVWVVLPRVSATQAVQSMARFSRLAPAGVTTVTLTGMVQSVRLHDGLDTLTETDHGRLLLVKIAMVAAMLLLGASARRRLRIAAASEALDVDALRVRLRRAAAYEGVIGLAIVGTTAALVASSFAG